MTTISSRYRETVLRLRKEIREFKADIVPVNASDIDRDICCYFCLDPIDKDEKAYVLTEKEKVNNVEFTSTYYINERCYRDSLKNSKK